MFAHPPGDVGVNHVAVFQLDAEGGVRKGFHHGADHFDVFFFGHSYLYGGEKRADCSKLAGQLQSAPRGYRARRCRKRVNL